MAFSNQSIVAPVDRKPHIVLRAGFWRVSPFRPRWRKYSKCHRDWTAAHDFVRRLNASRPFAGSNWNLVAVDEMKGE
ncbi:hypothetical protein P7I17_gp42 [Escherichia phage Halfdan]|uniref:Uncharacterized protein n=1 Tax=Escherichia phage Halfdan TaxID=2234092 RepID=A0A2Z5H3C2_9CAUD|nr:hypothetical protein P7I17_gp42 [Escherichia phage Halfdan]AXC34296.1 hypothetical protein [Escherichia phage Halfdan]